MRRRRLGFGVAAWLALGATACASYAPRPGPHIVADASATYYRDGGEYKVGAWGGGGDALVAWSPRALPHVERKHRLARNGTLVYILGLATMTGGAIAASSSSSSSVNAPLLWGSLTTGLGITFWGVYMMLEGNAALVDAINVYNDEVDARSQGGRP